MPQRNANPKHSDEVREAIKAAIDAIAEYHGVVAASNAEVVAKIAQVARALGWPDHVGFRGGPATPKHCRNADQDDRSHFGSLAGADNVVAESDLGGPLARRGSLQSDVGQPGPVLDTRGGAVAEELGTDDDVAVGEVGETEYSSQRRRSGITVIILSLTE